MTSGCYPHELVLNRGDGNDTAYFNGENRLEVIPKERSEWMKCASVISISPLVIW